MKTRLSVAFSMRMAAASVAAVMMTCFVEGVADDATTEEPALQPLPEKLVVLTFDDAVRSHLTVVAPILSKYGFGASFCVCNAWMDDEENFLSWPEVGELHRQGFEVANHTWNHVPLHEEDGAKLARTETQAVEDALKKVGVPRCISLSWPGSHFGPESLGELRKLSYVFGRRGIQPGVTAGATPLYQPEVHDPLLIPTTGAVGPEWTLDTFRATVDRASKGKIVVLMFHGVPDNAHPFCSTPPERFEAFMGYLAERDFTVIALRDLRRYIRPEPKPEDAAFGQRFYR